jgi:hypothetical protein
MAKRSKRDEYTYHSLEISRHAVGSMRVGGSRSTGLAPFPGPCPVVHTSRSSIQRLRHPLLRKPKERRRRLLASLLQCRLSGRCNLKRNN